MLFGESNACLSTSFKQLRLAYCFIMRRGIYPAPVTCVTNRFFRINTGENDD